jgi:phosphoacetylglucosamine mutase
LPDSDRTRRIVTSSNPVAHLSAFSPPHSQLKEAMKSAQSSRIAAALASAGPSPDPALKYGTAGFRAAATRLPGALVRVGALAALRSAAAAGAATGVMVTASHNPAPDNGAKIVDPSGAMLAHAWESRAAAFVTAPNEDVCSALDKLVDGLLPDGCKPESSVVVVGGDTRESTNDLVAAVTAGVEAVGGRVVILGYVTTPALHFAVRAMFRGEPATTADYYKATIAGFKKMIALAPSKSAALPMVVVDCANGVGMLAMREIGQGICNVLEDLTLINGPGDGVLNASCGADFVQKKREMPDAFVPATVAGSGCKQPGTPPTTIFASLDGDADRLVLYKRACSSGNDVVLADGDRFAALVAMFSAKHLEIAGMSDVTIGVAQTAYSNGAATKYLSSLRGVEVVIAKTGVKHLEIAIHPFDIGIYWEPNGHGTVLYSDSFSSRIEKTLEALGNGDGDAQMRASLELLASVGKLANQAVGDGVADLLLVLGMLKCSDMSFDDWLALYDERCSANMVVHVADKDAIITEDCDQTVIQPSALRSAVESAVGGGEGRRAFVRSSGTEDVVRVYAESPAGRQGEAQDIALAIARAVYDTCSGVGDRA